MRADPTMQHRTSQPAASAYATTPKSMSRHPSPRRTVAGLDRRRSMSLKPSNPFTRSWYVILKIRFSDHESAGPCTTRRADTEKRHACDARRY